MNPEAFWNTHPRDFWWMFESRLPEKKFGDMTERDVDQILHDINNGMKRNGSDNG